MALAHRPEPAGTPMDVELTRMRRRHLRRVLNIESRVYPRPWSASLFMSELSHRGSRKYIVARHRGEVVGYAGMMFTGNEAHITNIAVDPEVHTRKIGTRMMLALLYEALARGCEVISLEVRVSNESAQAMYRKFGFEVAGIRRGYYIETNEDAYVMEASNALSNEYRELLRAIREELDALLEGGTGQM